MTNEEKIIATAFTGKMFIDGTEMGALYEYMEKKVGHGVIDLMLASKEFWEELHKACEQDFIDMVSKEQPELPSNLDEAAVEFSKDVASGHIYKDLCVGFKAGAEWQKEQVLKDAVDGKVYFQIGGIKRVKSDDFENSGIHLGDKVRIIIVKEE